MSTDWYAPNQQAVRESPPSGGDSPTDLDTMTKQELLDYAAENDVPADSTMTKAEIRAAINGDD